MPPLSLEGRIGKLTQHAPDWGFGTKGFPPPGAAAKVGDIAKSIVDNASSIKQGPWGKGTAIAPDALFFSDGQHVVVTQPDGKFITILKEAATVNKRFLNAVPLWP
jgi:hypothetical protein